MITLIKLGGSLITDKKLENAFRVDAATRIAAEIADALRNNPDLSLIIGHGSGSFGHVAARRHDTIHGVRTPDQWRGFAEVATVAAELNALMAKTLSAAGIPVWRLQPSASARAHDGRIVDMALHPLRVALEHRLIPLVYGDVALDDVRGGTILSTETVFFYLAQHLQVERILLLGDVDGVHDHNGVTIPLITPSNFPEIERALGGSAGTDVTGGMETKVRDMLALAQRLPQLSIRILNGSTPGLLITALLDTQPVGTLIRADDPALPN